VAEGVVGLVEMESEVGEVVPGAREPGRRDVQRQRRLSAAVVEVLGGLGAVIERVRKSSSCGSRRARSTRLPTTS
jgi:hypothetical protein